MLQTTSDVLGRLTCEESRDGLNLRGAASDIDARKNARFPRGRQASAHNQPALGYQDGLWTWHQKGKLSKKENHRQYLVSLKGRSWE